MIANDNQDFIEQVSRLLESGECNSLVQVAKVLKMPYGTLYSRIRNCGYGYEQIGKLVPIHAEPIPKTAA